ncbi:unnamed protein product (macronuclear) [Paramecium tetraurelia]|uniref:Uncharacterized protein n=1 Tax=Paramecium tetraurelia TaxID=5888 RepID=A0BLE1_PARTE|nr:uncharacterized protein GSPATT00029991001 [Paramecium tetraurelia]CAK59358.1 unnamed protein product [Paramecium tetraurelia]|eukprot:XP_001426756.1 hypothetical protein (macronuclear) [Paramecium tetraurelia strain d4-2]
MSSKQESGGSEKQGIGRVEISEEPQTVVWSGQSNIEIQILVDKSFGDSMSYEDVLKYKSILARKILGQ